MEEKIKLIVAYLNKVKTRCTYGAVAEILGIKSQAVGLHLGERRPEASWIVNAKTKDPTDYLESEKHPELYRTDRVITSAEVLRRNLGFSK
jgi:hypothetical protein